MANPGGQRAVTRDEYDDMNPYQQGFVSYMQGAWNKEIPDFCPYPEGSKQETKFADGEIAAMLLAQDSDD
jgi:hypothetical protein